MDFYEYQQATDETAVYSDGVREIVYESSIIMEEQILTLSYLTLGLVGEAGEVANKLKKVIRGDRSLENAKEAVSSELGDVLWYAAQIAETLDMNLNDIAADNLKKLDVRKTTHVIKGDGDNR